MALASPAVTDFSAPLPSPLSRASAPRRAPPTLGSPPLAPDWPRPRAQRGSGLASATPPRRCRPWPSRPGARAGGGKKREHGSRRALLPPLAPRPDPPLSFARRPSLAPRSPQPPAQQLRGRAPLRGVGLGRPMLQPQHQVAVGACPRPSSGREGPLPLFRPVVRVRALQPHPPRKGARELPWCGRAGCPGRWWWILRRGRRGARPERVKLFVPSISRSIVFGSC